MRLVPVQEHRHGNNRDMGQQQSDDNKAPPGQVEDAEERVLPFRLGLTRQYLVTELQLSFRTLMWLLTDLTPSVSRAIATA